MELLSDDDSLIYRNARVKSQGGEIAVAAEKRSTLWIFTC